MATLLPFLRVPDVALAKEWYESIGFTCLGTHEEPGCGLDWALMGWEDTQFMLYAQFEDTVSNAKNCGLYFNLDSLDGILEKLEGKATLSKRWIKPNTEEKKSPSLTVMVFR